MQTKAKTPAPTRVGGIGEDRGLIPIAILMTAIMLMTVIGLGIYLFVNPHGFDSSSQTPVYQRSEPASTTQRVGEMQTQRNEPRGPIPGGR